MRALSSVAGAIIVVIIILIAAGASLLIISEPRTSITFSTSSTTTTQKVRTTTQTPSTSTSTITTPTTTTTSSTKSYSLEEMRPGSGPSESSPLTTSEGTVYFQGDGPCCSKPPVYSNAKTYNDNGNSWTLQGDYEPGIAWFSANSTGLTISDQACDGSSCGPRQEANAGEAFDDVSFYGDVSIPSNATLFSIEAYIPYHSYYSSCTLDKGQSGCTYELLPYDAAALALDVSGNLIVVSFAEVCNNPCSTNGLQMSAYTSGGGSSVNQVLNTIDNSTYTPLHTLTIATDRKSFIELYVDNILLYSSTTMPIDLSGGGGSIEISERTSINGEVDSVTWSNFLAYSSSEIAVSGLSSGMTLVASGSNGFNETLSSFSNGVGIINVTTSPSNVSVSVELDGKVIASKSALKSGAFLTLNTS
ncbi:MAG: hypothetical protein ACYCQJ_01315 [Nitrososphaerales archaeon]